MADTYARDVISGTILACEGAQQACQRYLDDRSRDNDPDWPYRFDHAAAERVCRFVELCPHTKGKWASQREMMVLQPWQAWLIVNCWGFLRKRDGKRRFRYAVTVVPRKNGKSALTAALCLYSLCADNEFAAEVYSGASSEKQAWEVFRPCVQMCRSTPALVSHYGITINARNLNIMSTGSRCEPIIGKPGDGASPSFCAVDEYHEHETSHLRDTMLTGMGAREQPMLWVITTAGDNLSGPCYDDILTGRKILQGVIEDEERFFVEWTIDDSVRWDTPEAIRMANPNVGVSVDESFLLSRLKEAVRNAREQGRYKTKHLNCWVNSRSAFFNMESWRKCYDPELALDQFKGQSCVLSLDLASKVDIAALNILFRHADGTYATFGKYYLPEEIIDQAGKDHYKGWAIDNKLIMTPGNMISHERIADDIDDLIADYDVTDIVFDPSQANWMMGRLTDRGLPVYAFGQYAKNFSEPMKQVAALIDAGKLKHANAPNDPMSWMMSNCVSKFNAKDEVFPAKEKDENKIDGCLALIMGMARSMLHPEITASIYETRGVIHL